MTQGNTRFRTSFTYTQGNVSSLVVQGKVAKLNLSNWTVDVYSQFDQKRYFDIQVGSPYIHYSNGEGISAFPEVGAKCMVCIPSDSSPPFIQSYIMPVEIVDMAAPDAPNGSTSQSSPGTSASGASFGGGRPKIKPGDIWMRTRDDNFVILHRGGVLQIGATELAQRLFIPLNHYIMDISQNYAHHSAGGSILWGIQDAAAGASHYPTEYTHSFRVFSDYKSADIRVKVGKVSDPMPEPIGDDGNQPDIDLLNLGKGEDYIVAEVAITPESFNPETGALEKAALQKPNVLRFFFDRAGGVFLRAQSNVFLSTKKKLVIRAKDGIDIGTDQGIAMSAKNGAILDGGAFAHVKGSVVKLGPGSTPVAMQGGMVLVTLPFTPMPVPGSPPLALFGTIKSGNPQVLG
jgi:hypothetical protein